MSGIRLGVREVFDDPVVVREGRTRSRAAVTPLALTIVLGAVAAVACILFSLASAGAPDHRPNAAQMARVAYHAMAFQLGLVLLVTPALAARAIAGEREAKTLDLLMLGEMSSWDIIRAKAVSTVSYVLLFVVAALPLYVAIFLHAGLDLGDLAMAELLTVVSTVAAAALGILASALCPRVSTATLAACGLALALCLDVVLAGVVPAPGTGLPQTRRMLLDGSFGGEVGFEGEGAQGTGDSPVVAAAEVVHPVRVANPLYALNQLVTDPGRSVPSGQLGRALVPGGKSRSTWGPALKPWQVSVLAQLTLSLLFLGLAARLVSVPAGGARRREPADPTEPSRVPEPTAS